jgi:hypothetical protein
MSMAYREYMSTRPRQTRIAIRISSREIRGQMRCFFIPETFDIIQISFLTVFYIISCFE